MTAKEPDDFMHELLNMGFELKIGKESQYDGDFEDLGPLDNFKSKKKARVFVWRESQYYFTIVADFGQDNRLFATLPLKNIQITNKADSDA